MMKGQKLVDVLPCEFEHYQDSRAWKHRDDTVIKEYDSRDKPWPGTHKNVCYWWVVLSTNGKLYGIGFNENPSIGWSFPVKRLHTTDITKINGISREIMEIYQNVDRVSLSATPEVRSRLRKIEKLLDEIVGIVIGDVKLVRDLERSRK